MSFKVGDKVSIVSFTSLRSSGNVIVEEVPAMRAIQLPVEEVSRLLVLSSRAGVILEKLKPPNYLVQLVGTNYGVYLTDTQLTKRS